MGSMKSQKVIKMSCTTGLWLTTVLLGLALGGMCASGAVFRGAKVILPLLGTGAVTNIKQMLPDSRSNVAFAVVLVKNPGSTAESTSPMVGSGLDTAFRRGDPGLLFAAVEKLPAGKTLIREAAAQQCLHQIERLQQQENEECNVASVSIRSHDRSMVARGLLVNVDNLGQAESIAAQLNQNKRLTGTVHAVKIYKSSCDSAFTAVNRSVWSKLPVVRGLFRGRVGSQAYALRSWSSTVLLSVVRLIQPFKEDFQCVLTTTAYKSKRQLKWAKQLTA